MKHKMLIGEFAKLRNVTTEALRHYDRVGLLKPMETDPETGYRYYSIFQSEKLATIIELKALGFSIEEMKAYFNNRQLQQSYDLLKDKHQSLVEKIEMLQKLEQSIEKKLLHLSDMLHIDAGENYIIRNEKSRVVAFMETLLESEATFGIVASELENLLHSLTPVIGSDAYGLMVNSDAFSKGKIVGGAYLIYLIDDESEIDPKYVRRLPDRSIACFLSRGKIKEQEEEILEMLECLRKDGYEMCGDPLIILRIDGTVTDIRSEILYEFQIPVRKLDG